MATGEGLSHELERLLSEGGEPVAEQLFEVLYEELDRLAGRVRHGRASETMSTTALVHEAYLKLVGAGSMDLDNRLHFFRVAARAMRQILVDAARGRLAEKRGGDLFPITFDDALHAAPMPATTFLALNGAIDHLADLDPRVARVVECRFFAGLTVEETASALDISKRTVKRDWRVARALLTAQLSPAER